MKPYCQKKLWLEFDISYIPTGNVLTVSSATQEILDKICDAFIPALMKQYHKPLHYIALIGYVV